MRTAISPRFAMRIFLNVPVTNNQPIVKGGGQRLPAPQSTTNSHHHSFGASTSQWVLSYRILDDLRVAVEDTVPHHDVVFSAEQPVGSCGPQLEVLVLDRNSHRSSGVAPRRSIGNIAGESEIAQRRIPRIGWKRLPHESSELVVVRRIVSNLGAIHRSLISKLAHRRGSPGAFAGLPVVQVSGDAAYGVRGKNQAKQQGDGKDSSCSAVAC